MRLISASVPALVITILLAGCSEPAWFKLYNNTPDTIVVTDGNKKRFAVASLSHIRLVAGINETTGFLVEIGTIRTACDFPHGVGIPRPFWSDKRGCTDLCLQLQPDRKIYIVHPCSTFPVQDLPEQPNGFPLSAVRTIE